MFKYKLGQQVQLLKDQFSEKGTKLLSKGDVSVIKKIQYWEEKGPVYGLDVLELNEKQFGVLENDLVLHGERDDLTQYIEQKTWEMYTTETFGENVIKVDFVSKMRIR